MTVIHNSKKVKELCTDYKKAKKKLGQKVAEKLFALINLLEASESLTDIQRFKKYHLHALVGNREGEYALDVVDRSYGYRLIISPLSKDKAAISLERANEIVIWEVSNHYE